MSNGCDLGDVTFFINGEAIGTLNAIDIEIDALDTDSTTCEEFRFPKTLAGTFTDVKINERFMGLLPYNDHKFKFIAESYNLPRGNKLPKKKRIRLKWLKKYYKKIELDNVTIDGQYY